MKHLYKKSELTFSLVLVGLYVALFSIADNLSRSIGIEKILTAPLSVLFVAVLYVWIHKNGLLKKYGLCAFDGKAKDYFYFIPLFVIGSCNLWNGVQLNCSPMETALYVLSMLCVGFIEELIFRGFLFKAMAKDGIKSAIIVSSITLDWVTSSILLMVQNYYLHSCKLSMQRQSVFFLLCCFIRGNVCGLVLSHTA